MPIVWRTKRNDKNEERNTKKQIPVCLWLRNGDRLKLAVREDEVDGMIGVIRQRMLYGGLIIHGETETTVRGSEVIYFSVGTNLREVGR